MAERESRNQLLKSSPVPLVQWWLRCLSLGSPPPGLASAQIYGVADTKDSEGHPVNIHHHRPNSRHPLPHLGQADKPRNHHDYGDKLEGVYFYPNSNPI